MIINATNLRALNIAFNTAFQGAFDATVSHWEDVASSIPSSTLEEEYGWLGLFPQVREWLGDRVIQGISVSRYAIRNRDFELTIEVPRNAIMDDKIGIYTPMFQEMGRSTKEHPDKLIFGLIGAGFSTVCYDGQNFFDTDHPVIDEDGVTITSVSNMQAGAGPAWFLLDTSRSIKPFIYQNRMPFNFVSKDKPEDDNVFMQKNFIYGVDGRSNAGYGFWQMAFGSKADLTPENYEAARVAMTSLKGDNGHRLGITPTTLVVPTELEGAGRRLINSALKSETTTVTSGGSDINITAAGTNEWAGSAKLIVTPWL